MTFKPRSAVVWFAVGGGPLAFALQFVSGLAFTFAQCNQPDGRWQLPVRSWQLALSAAALLIGLASMATAVWLFVRTFRIGDVFEEERSGGGSAPPLGRIHFLAIVALVVDFLALTIIVMDGVGAPLLSLCQQA
jgi:hypothetical protein